MEIYTIEDQKQDKFLIHLSKKEAKVLFDAVETARNANRRKASFRTLLNNLEQKLCVF